MVADKPAREADQDRREGHQPRALRDIPDGRGRRAETDVRRHSVADRPAEGAARAGMTGAAIRCGTERWSRCALTQAKHAFWRSGAANECLRRHAGHATPDLPLLKTPEGPILPRNEQIDPVNVF